MAQLLAVWTPLKMSSGLNIVWNRHFDLVYKPLFLVATVQTKRSTAEFIRTKWHQVNPQWGEYRSATVFFKHPTINVQRYTMHNICVRRRPRYQTTHVHKINYLTFTQSHDHPATRRLLSLATAAANRPPFAVRRSSVAAHKHQSVLTGLLVDFRNNLNYLYLISYLNVPQCNFGISQRSTEHNRNRYEELIKDYDVVSTK